MTPRQWTCQRVAKGEKCAHVNPARKRNCERCGKPRPPRRSTANVRVIRDISYDEYIERNGGEHCGICGRGRPPSGRRLHRDHDHMTGASRGLLCFPCNLQLRTWATPEWLRAAADYLERWDPEAAARRRAAADYLERSPQGGTL